MKKALYSLLFLLCLVPAVQAANYLEGIEYDRLPTAQPVDTGNRIEVREVFWYGCPHCYTLEPHIQRWLKTKPANAEFVRMPGILRDSWEPQGRAYYTFEALGVLDKLHTPFFKAIHEGQQNLNDEASVANFVAQHGVDQNAFRKAYRSFSVDAAVKNAIRLGERYGLDSVPSIIVDGKYRTSAAKAGSYEALMDIVNFLVQKAAAERKSKKSR
jgi:thiol:disulfide interchange protein DsbA